MSKIYHIHDNGGRPFTVEIENDEVMVSVKDDVMDRYKKFVTYKPQKIFIGTDWKEISEKSQDHRDYFDGNSFLLHISDLDYVYIGSMIYTFRAENLITEYVSRVGNSDVPYPHAIDLNGNVYLTIEDVILLNCDKMKNFVKRNPDKDYYDYYYSNNKMISGSFENIKKVSIGGRDINITYSTDPINDYNFCRLDKEEMTITHGSGIEQSPGYVSVMTRNDYIDLMNRYGDFMNFKKLKYVMIHDRRW